MLSEILFTYLFYMVNNGEVPTGEKSLTFADSPAIYAHIFTIGDIAIFLNEMRNAFVEFLFITFTNHKIHQSQAPFLRN